jgi:hypothetical protein
MESGQVGVITEHRDSQQTSKLGNDNTNTKDSSKQKRLGWVKVKSNYVTRPKKQQSKNKNQFIRK